ncbi:MAG: archaeosine synthase subunit alpha, partial [Halobacteriota archaeon]|nr:archaeosine synthase subunit alpha [Halobacteriota archaeon]
PPMGRFASNARLFVNSIVKVRESIPSDTALYTPAAATPENLAILIYAGVDLVDDTIAKISGFRDLYLTNEGEVPISELSCELPCLCEVCGDRTSESFKKLKKKERSLLISRHNELKLTEEMRRVRHHIMNGSIREYVEKQCRSSPFLCASVRLFDREPQFLEKRTPVARGNVLYANTMESLDRIEIRRFASRVRDRYDPPSKKKILVLLPCSARKPYSTSPSHYSFIQALNGYRDNLHEVIITSPLGVVPRELELVYPAAHYDIPVTGYWDREEKAWVSGRLEDYLRDNRYEEIIAHLDGAYRDICEEASSRLNLKMEYTSIDGVLGRESLDNLRS